MKSFAVGGILGPASFFLGWLLLGMTIDSYDPVSTAISELARTGRITAPAMTVAFLGFSLGLTGLAVATRKDPRTYIAIVVAVIGSTGVALAPLGTADTAHFAFAALSYVALAVLPILAARHFGGRRSTAMGVLVGLCLIFSVVGPASVHGLFQRTGLSIADLWLVAFSMSVLRAQTRTS